jgi:hypothetical protein
MRLVSFKYIAYVFFISTFLRPGFCMDQGIQSNPGVRCFRDMALGIQHTFLSYTDFVFQKYDYKMVIAKSVDKEILREKHDQRIWAENANFIDCLDESGRAKPRGMNNFIATLEESEATYSQTCMNIRQQREKAAQKRNRLYRRFIEDHSEEKKKIGDFLSEPEKYTREQAEKLYTLTVRYYIQKTLEVMDFATHNRVLCYTN